MTTISLAYGETPHPELVTLRVSFLSLIEDAALLAPSLCEEVARVKFNGAVGESAWTMDAPRSLVGVVGVADTSKPGNFRRAAYHALALARSLKAQQLVIDLPQGTSGEGVAHLAQGLRLTTWRFDLHKKKAEENADAELTRVVVVGEASKASAFERGVSLADSVGFARDLVNEHPGLCTPDWLATQAKTRAEALGLEVQVLDEDELQARGFNLHLAVARGSDEPARLLHAIYRPAGAVTKRVALVGKGVTFDSGGYSIKPSASMVDMHMDMGGAAAVIGAMDAVGRHKPEGVEVHFIAPMAENLISGSAYKINEVIRAYNGTTVEIIDTDAEGRLLLADALAYAVEQGVDEVIDLATLTGACVVALGMETAGVFSPSTELRDGLCAAAESAEELVWPLPLVERMGDKLKSRVADLKNLGPRWGGAISAAMFLQHFVGETKWAHLDVAGPAMADAAWEYIPAGGTGFGVLTLAHYLGVRAE